MTNGTVRGDDNVRALSFGSDAGAYDAARPSYPAALYDDLLSLVPDRPRVLEVGAGTGLATAELSRRGTSVVALEPDARMIGVLQRKDLPHVEAQLSSFEDWEGTPASFDMVVSAQAWHWLDPETATVQAALSLKPRALLAVWWNMPALDRSESMSALDAIYEEYEPDLVHTSVMVRVRTDGRFTAPIEASPRFDDIRAREYHWTQRYSADDYVTLLGTHSDHRTLPDERRERLLNAIRAQAAETGGVEFRYQTECTIATRVP